MTHLVSSTAQRILDAIDNGVAELDISLDLGLTTTRLNLSEQKWTVEQLEKISKDPESVYFVSEDGVFMAAIRGRHFYKLYPSGETTAPAMLIDGVLMHRVKGVNPMEDARMKAKLCAKPGIDVLEICTGLGYSTIACLETGIRSIVTIERDPEVINLARVNPWSQGLFTDKRITMVSGDASEKIPGLERERFHAVLHDPPRFSMATELYTTDFYSQLLRVLRNRGVLYHYVGSPGSRYGGKDLQRGIIKRLRDAGFIDVARDAASLGIVARKT